MSVAMHVRSILYPTNPMVKAEKHIIKPALQM